ncbi:hydroxymethylbilane synthase [Halobacillus karajensis]|uniref:Porphobilinogen deaminase n=1 Tax=Halobacillus karajensis TaxID=195088 RepID=A0A024P862_9BACI|nr:hydroxymethylbilane synthase [Halobacillus karajensis]CDQ18190.1 Porphobilinogen deaminase [Halobacillus karajensis]CDQ24542.1 Porphobilinogen deaminase [Halobacillus karajensis]CDQ29211.1 Porphobilinogen deaminase [Halobacillus karajensis]SEH57548.1 hydroxymethylbilane synthase [Halobacillus karajensis]
MRKIVIGSRKSNLAITQTEWVIDQLKQIDSSYDFEIKRISTKGDRIVDVTLSKVGGKGLFIKEIEQAMYDGEIDMAVHSMKDMPAVVAEGLMVAAVPIREDHRDAFVSNGNVSLKDLPEGAVIGTSSLRRGSQIKAVRPDVEIKWIRGNIDTRLRKLKDEDYDAIVLAAAGLKRMGWDDDVVTEYLEPEVCVPAVGQGALAIQCRENDSELRGFLEKLNHEYTETTVACERKFLHDLNGGCQVPIGGYAYRKGEEIVLTALVGTPDGQTILHETVAGTDPIEVGKEAADRLKARGAQEIVDHAKEEYDQ